MNEQPLPIGLKVVLAFFLFEGLKNAGEVFHTVMQTPNATSTITWLGILTAANLSLAVILWLRIRIGPIWAIFLLATELIWNLTYLTVETPDHWIQVGMIGRVGIIATFTVELALISYLIFLQIRPQSP